MSHKRTGILLAGGASRRFGQAKAFIQWQQRYFYEYAYDALAAVSDEVIIATRSNFVKLFPSHYKIVQDLPAYDGNGPLAAIYSVMTRYPSDSYLTLPCDMPFVTADIMAEFSSRHKASDVAMSVVEIEGYKQSLMAIWETSTKKVIEKQLNLKQFALKKIYDALTYQVIQSTELSDNNFYFQNINDEEQWKEIVKWLKS